MRIELMTLCMALCSLCLNATSQSVPDYVPTDGLVAWWPLDGDAVDASAANEVGELNGVNEAENRFNEPNTALQFEGEVSFVNLGLENLLSLSEDDTLSIAFWAMAEGGGAPITKYQNSGYGSSWFVEYGTTYGYRFWGDGTSGTPSSANWSSQCPNDPSGWAHVVVVFNGGSGVLWLNGEFICESNFPVSSLPQEQPVLLGRSNCPTEENCNQFSGKLDDLGFWTRALTEEEILGLYNAEPPISGCTDSTACNFDSEATSDDGSCIPSGCMETEACNYNALAECDGEECDYSCCPGPGCCGEGMFWDYELEQCQIFETCQEDLDGDGGIGINDLMQLLSSFGTMCEDSEPETGEFTCGDPMNYQGYDYATVQIGEQCWFAENCRYLLDVSPPSLGFEDDSLAHAYVYGYEGSLVGEAVSTENYALHGVLYNQLAAETWDVCPTGWHVPFDSNIPQQGDFEELKLSLPADAIGTALKASSTGVPPWDGSNSSGFNAIPSGTRSLYWDGEFSWLDITAFYWSQSDWSRRLDTNDENLALMGLGAAWGLSVRCIKD